MNQVLAAAALFGAATLVLAPLVAESGRQIGSRSQSVSEMMEDSRLRSGQVLVSTWSHSSGGSTTVYISSIGQQAVAVSGAMVDGAPVPYRLSGQDSAETDSLEPGSLGVLSVNGTGRVQLVSESGKLFELGP